MEITIIEYNPKWKLFFQNELVLLKKIFVGQYISINHIGSTSVHNLAAKPIVDVSIGVTNLKEIEFYKEHLKSTGYEYLAGSEIEEWILFEKKLPERFNLHIMSYRSKRLLEQLVFKHCLLVNGRLATDYARLKKYFMDYDDNLFYSINKLPFVTNVVNNFKKGFLEASKDSENEFYKYVQINFTENTKNSK